MRGSNINREYARIGLNEHQQKVCWNRIRSNISREYAGIGLDEHQQRVCWNWIK